MSLTADPIVTSKSYRDLTLTFIQIADCYTELCQEEAVFQAVRNALKAFNEIEYKTSNEKAIGDPSKNFIGFYRLIQEKASYEDFSKTQKFKNWQTILVEQK